MRKISFSFSFLSLVLIGALLTPPIAQAYVFNNQLDIGDSGEDVSALQQTLTDLKHFSYPTITGYFGPITQTAVQAFQAARGIVSSGTPESTGYGRVGPQTLAELNSIQDNDGSIVTTREALLEQLRVLQARLAELQGDTDVATNPNLATPINLEAKEDDRDVTLTWDEVADATSYLVKRKEYRDSYQTLATTTNATYTDEDISRGTRYYYTVTAVNDDGYGRASESVYVYISRPGGGGRSNDDSDPADTTAPIISSVSSSVTSTTTATITWTTDEAATSKVVYGLSPSYGTASTSVSLTTSHSISLSGFNAGTTYHFAVVSTDSDGNTATSTDYTFVADSLTAVFLLAGQSNMVGAGVSFDDGDTYPSGTLQWGRIGDNDGELVTVDNNTNPMEFVDVDPEGSYPETGFMGIYVQFAIDYYERTGRPIVFIPTAKGNTGFGNGWAVDGSLYNDSVSRTNAAMAALGADATFEGILWHQGEYEASSRTPVTHRQNLIDMIAGMREDITAADENTPFILGGLLPAFVTAGGYSDTQTMLEGFPEYVAYTSFASSTGLTGISPHFDAAGYRTLGSRYDDALANSALNVPEIPSEVQDLDATPGDGEMALDWDIPADIGGRPITDYVIQYRETGGGSYTTFSDGTSTATTTTVTGLTNSTSYDFQVAAVNAAGEGAATSTTATPSVPVSPLEILAFDSADYTTGGAGTSSVLFEDVTVDDGTVLVSVVSGNFGVATAMTIDGVTATQIGVSTANNFSRSFWIAEGVTGAVADVAVTFNNASAASFAITAWTLPDSVTEESDIAFYADTTYGDSEGDHVWDFSVEAAVLNGGAVLGFLGGYTSGEPSSGTWTGATARFSKAKVGGGTGVGVWYTAADYIADSNEMDRAIRARLNTGAGMGLVVVVIDP